MDYLVTIVESCQTTPEPLKIVLVSSQSNNVMPMRLVWSSKDFMSKDQVNIYKIYFCLCVV